MITVYGN
jgi:hypothetical protein